MGFDRWKNDLNYLEETALFVYSNFKEIDISII